MRFIRAISREYPVATVAQLAEQLIRNQQAEGSSPSSGSGPGSVWTHRTGNRLRGERSPFAERYLPIGRYRYCVPKGRRAANQPPKGFSVNRGLGKGRHSLLEAFPGIEKLPAFAAIATKDPRGPARLALTEVEVVEADIWMYVAPSDPDEIGSMRSREGWKPVFSGEKDVVVVGHDHIAESPEILLYLDILHELCHVTQRHRGMHLWAEGYSYVDRPTEIEAYQFVIEEARRLGATTPFLQEYLKVEWVSDEDYQRLLEKMGLPGT